MSEVRDMIEEANTATDSSETEEDTGVSSEEEDTDHQGDINGNDTSHYNRHNTPKQNKLSQYEMVRENNIRECREKFKEIFKEMNELKKSMVGEKNGLNPRQQQQKQQTSLSSTKHKKSVELPSRRSERIVCNQSKNQNTEETKPDIEDGSQEKRNRKLSFKDRTGFFLPNCSELGFIVGVRNIGPGGYLVSNDLADLAQTQCQLCGLIVGFTELKDHVGLKHDLLFSLYKKEFGGPQALETILHLCRLCDDRVMFHKNSLASHLRFKHREMTVQEYIGVFCVDSRGLGQDLGKKTVVQPTVDIQLLEREKIHHLLPWSVVEHLGEENCETEVDLEVPEEEDIENCGTDDNMEVSLEDSFVNELLDTEEKANVDIDKDMEIAEEEDEDMSEIEILSDGDEDDEDGDISFIFVPSKKIKTEY